MRELLSNWFKKFSRRQFVLKASLASLSLPYLWFTKSARAQSSDLSTTTCPIPDITVDMNVVALQAEQVLFWVHNASDLGVGTLSILVLRQQTASSYVNRVVLTDEGLDTLAEKYFTADTTDSTGCLPYLIFDNISLQASRYFLFLEVREGSAYKSYRYTFVSDQTSASKFSGNNLPKFLVDLFSTVFNSQVSTPYYNAKALFLTTSCIAKNVYFNTCFQEHRITCYFKSISSNNDFELVVNFAHPDAQDHYMRYFILTDPVGRILGIKQRQYNEQPLGQTVIQRITSDQIKQWGIILTALISDCPYVMLFWEENKHALRQRILWLH